MNAFHTLWTKPSQNLNKKFFLEDFCLLTMILSAKMWRKKNGQIFLVTDSLGKEYLENLNLLDTWDNVYTYLDDFPNDINPQTFWAGGKIFALSKMNTPIVSIDTDFIVWDTLTFDNISLAVIHKEELNNEIYPHMDELISLCQPFFETELPSNTAFYYCNDREFLKEYTDTAFTIMKSCSISDPIIPMVFAEQRIFSVCAKKLNIEIFEISNLKALMSGNDKRFTHLWGAKKELRKNAVMRKELCRRLKKRIKNL